jgi:hypothetical protein
MEQSVIVLELNELSPVLMRRFIGRGLLRGFARLLSESVSCVTDAEEEHPTLEPWIQWITVHTGLSYAQHQVFDLGEGPKLAAPRIWDLASEAGKEVWVCGSMNAAIQGERLNGAVLPDPWAVGVRPYPEGRFDAYSNLIRAFVQQYTQAAAPVRKADMLRFARFMIGNGLSAATVFGAMRQLLEERTKGASRERRAATLDRLQWDVFRHHYRQHRPALATFFINSTAHFQHYHWRNMEPEIFALKPTAEDQAKHADLVLFGYQQMDKIVQEAFELAGPNTTIALCTGLSQQPMHIHDDVGGKQIFKVQDYAALARFAGIRAPHKASPVMAEQFHLIFESEADAADAAQKLTALKMADGAQTMLVRQEGARVFSGCQIHQPPAAEAVVSTPQANAPGKFYELFYPVGLVRSGMHHPDGLFWVRQPGHAAAEVARKLSLRELAPTLLALAGVDPGDRFAFGPAQEFVGAREKAIAAPERESVPA